MLLVPSVTIKYAAIPLWGEHEAISDKHLQSLLVGERPDQKLGGIIKGEAGKLKA